MPNPAATATPTVLFVDDDGWTSFDQVAAAVRRRGIRTVRVTTGPQPGPRRIFREPHLRWLCDRLFFHESIVLSAPAGRARLDALLDGGSVADVLVTEPTLTKIGLSSPLGRRLAARSLAFRATPAEVLLDKFAVNARLAEAGVKTPAQVRASEMSPAQAAERLGLPLMIKSPIGASGKEVRLARSVSEIEQALAALGDDRGQLFYQGHLEGRMAIYAAVAGPDGPLMEHGFAVEEAQFDLGPSSGVRLHDTPALMAAGRRSLEAFGCHGFASFGFMETSDGQLFHVDANCRPWGMIFAGLPLGIDYGAAYADLLRGRRRRPRPVRGDAQRKLAVFPHQLFDAALRASAPRMLGRTATFFRIFWAPVGWRYCTMTAGRAVMLRLRLIRDRIRARRRRRTFTPPDAVGAAFFRLRGKA